MVNAAFVPQPKVPLGRDETETETICMYNRFGVSPRVQITRSINIVGPAPLPRRGDGLLPWNQILGRTPPLPILFYVFILSFEPPHPQGRTADSPVSQPW